jgi:galactose mutarotase-like enzyme
MLRRLVILAALAALVGAAADRYRISSATAEGPEPPALTILTDSDSGLEAAIAPSQGGELSGLRVLFRGEWIETLYRARDYRPIEGFAGRAPFLWPATGRNVIAGEADSGRGFGYSLNSRRYPMPIHGFASHMPWRMEAERTDAAGTELTLSLSDTPETRKHYPFGFRITTKYRLADGVLTIAYTVRAPKDNSCAMPFSIGNHMTFLAPLVAGSNPAEMTVESPSTVEYLKEPPGLPTGESRPRSFATETPLAEIPRLSAVSLGGYDGDPYLVLRDPAGLAIRISHSAKSVPDQPVILFNLWGDLPGGFFSPEPWVGLQNSLNLKQGLVWLSPGQEWDWTIGIQPERAPSAP